MPVFGVILVRIFPHSDRTRKDTPYLSVFSPKCGKVRTRITPNMDTFYALSYIDFDYLYIVDEHLHTHITYTMITYALSHTLHIQWLLIHLIPTNQITLTCSKSKIETMEKRFETCSNLTIKTPERRHDVVLVFLLLTLNIFHNFF